MEFDDNVIAIIRKQDKTVSTGNQTFFDSLPATEQRIFAALSKHVQKFSSDGERFVFDDGNVLLTNQVEKIILDAIQGSTYPKDVNEFLRNFETLKQFNLDIHQSVNDLSPDELSELINPVQRATVEQTLQGLTGSGVSTNFIEPIRTGIFQNIVAGSTKSDLEAYLKRYILGTPEVDGTLSRYVKQVSRDALNQFDGQVNAKIANQFGLDAYRYVGSLIEDSRPQCRRWVAMGLIQTKDLPDEIAWMNANGTGAIPGTSPETFSIYRGGYNCRHSAIPFKLTKSQREKLNMAPPEVAPVKIEQQIREVEKEVAKVEKQTTSATKQKEIKPEIFLSTQNKPLIDQFNEVAANANGVIETINAKGTFVTLRKPSECTGPGTKKFAQTTGANLTLPTYQIGTVSTSSGGNCATDNSYLNVKIEKGQKILFKKYDIQSTEEWLKNHAEKYGYSIYTQGDRKVMTKPSNRKGYNLIGGELKNGIFKPGNISTIANDIDQNIAPTITHELAHAIQNANDPRRTTYIFNAMRAKDLKLSDAPSLYGQTNEREFWTESFTAYVYANDFLKTSYPKVFAFVEDYLKDMKIDINTVKIAE